MKDEIGLALAQNVSPHPLPITHYALHITHYSRNPLLNYQGVL